MNAYPPVPLSREPLLLLKMKEIGLSLFKMLHFPHEAKFCFFFPPQL